ncbi:DNA alkylation repair protein [Urechidicola vernalis]|uniref:DNA alkylation repair protein n=1 Tax=Urechidicola vernalis TaxID=3075600 RepID=A0ABU2Y0B5_9FLAO|nr:DNA alkylation repair protein [Urechidicola sp. P050]MDT0551614.1 DNA alkylation repair protein [Urechidicola sp. P050]
MSESGYLNTLETEFKRNADVAIAEQQMAYMRNQFKCFGLKTPLRRELQKPFLVKAYLPEKGEVADLVSELWGRPQREFQYFGQELAFKYVKVQERNDVVLYEYMITHKSWWDTVDFIAVKLLGTYFKKFPEQRNIYVRKWLESNNIWLQRSALLFQLKYKSEMDRELLRTTIVSLLGSKEFFINKAIGWVLREYSRTNPKWVVEFANFVQLNNLSRREALRLIKN